MAPQDIAPVPQPDCENAAFRPQHISLGCYLYIFTTESSILSRGYTQVTQYQIVGQAGSRGPVSKKKENWRKTCRTASNPCWLSVSSRWSRPVLTPRRSKNTSWLTPSPSRKNRSTPANTSNSARTGRRAYFGPAIHRSLSPREDAAC